MNLFLCMKNGMRWQKALEISAFSVFTIVLTSREKLYVIFLTPRFKKQNTKLKMSIKYF